MRFIARALELASPAGVVCLILPCGVLDYTPHRTTQLKLWQECDQLARFDLPSETFAPFTKCRTAALIVRKREVPRHLSMEELGRCAEELQPFFRYTIHTVGRDRAGHPIAESKSIFDHVTERERTFPEDETIWAVDEFSSAWVRGGYGDYLAEVDELIAAGSGR